MSDDKRVLMIVRDDSRFQDLMLEEEVFVMQAIVRSAGYSVDVVTVNDTPLTGEVTLEPDLPVADVDVLNYVGLLMPCMAPVPDPAITMPDHILPLITGANDRGLPIAAMRGSVRELGRSGVLAGHRYSAASDLELDDAEYAGTGVTRDANLATAASCPAAAKYQNGPNETRELVETLVKMLAESATA